MNASEDVVLSVARRYLSRSEVEKLAGLLQLRNHKNASVRVAANQELMVILSELDRLANPPRSPLRAV